MLHPGDLLSHFEGQTIDGREVPYHELWQRRNLVLFVVSPELQVAASSYLMALECRLSELKPSDTSLIISHCAIYGAPMKRLVIADRWGEVAHAAELTSDPVGWPSIDDVVEWVEFVRMKCPECPP